MFYYDNVKKSKPSLFFVRHKKIYTIFIFIIIIWFLVAACTRQIERKEFVVGIINPNPHTLTIVQGFIEGLQEYSSHSRYNVTVIENECLKNCDIKSSIQKLLDQNIDLLFCLTTPATSLAKEMTQATGLPVIFFLQDPIATGIIPSLIKPNGNMTGIQVRGAVPKALEWLRVVSPGLRQLFVPIRFDTKATRLGLVDLKEAANVLGIEVVTSEVNNEEELVAALSAMPENIDGIFVIRSLLADLYIDKIVGAGIARRIPMASATGKHNNGLTLSFGMNRYRAGKQASRLAHLIFMGENPGNIPAEQADFFLHINLRTAQASEVPIPQEILLLAHEIIR